MKKLATFNNWLLALIQTLTVFIALYYYKLREIKSALLIILFLGILLLPKIIEKIFKLKLVTYMETIYYIYTTLAILLGLMMHFYRIYVGYDTIIHLIWGFIITFIGLLILGQINRYDKSLAFNILFCISFSLATASIWEMLEYFYDNICNGNMQRVQTGVFDTMKDIIVHTLGTSLCVLWYTIIGKDKRTSALFNKGIIVKKNDY